MKALKLLDCTLRDGGYINDWNFGYDVIKGIIGDLVNSKVDIIEVGFLRNVEFCQDVTQWRTIKELKKILPKEHKNTVFSAMALHNQYELSQLEPYDGSGIELLRVTFHDYDIKEGLLYCKKVKSKGYKVSCNPINIMGYSDHDLLQLLEKVNELEPHIFSIVDTFGSMNRKDLERIVGIVDHNMNKHIALGLHLHENMAQSFSLAQSFINEHIDRQVIIDGSLMGMGRVPGNLSIELIADYLNNIYGKNYEIDYMLDSIESYIQPLKAEFGWGYSPVYFLSAKYNLHRNYAEYFFDKGDLTHRDINHLLSRISMEKRTTFDSKYANDLYNQYMNNKVDDFNAVEKLKERLNNAKILVLAPGSTINVYADKIKKYIKEESPVVISTNFIPSDIKVSYAFFSNNKRYDKVTDLHCNVIATSNLTKQADYVINYNRLAGTFEQGCNALIMLLQLLMLVQVKKVVLAGADGYKPESENYYNRAFRSYKIREANYNHEVSIALEKFDLQIEFLTPSKYQKG